MDETPPLPLFRGEQVLASWPTHYVCRRRRQGPAPAAPGWLSRVRNWLLTGEARAVKGHLHLTDWRLVFVATPHWSHRLEGAVSFFLVWLRWSAEPGRVHTLLTDQHLLRLIPQHGPSTLPDPSHLFTFHGDVRGLIQALVGQLHRARQRSGAEREDFEEHVAQAWWRAGIGLLSEPTRAALPGPFSTSPGHESYRAMGVDPPDFAALRSRLTGVEGEGLEQLRWLFAPPPPEPLLRIPGRPLRVCGEPRVGASRRGTGWG